MWKKRKSSTTFTFNGEKVFLAASQTLGTVFSYFQTSRIGLTQEEVEARQSLYGKNEVEHEQKKNPISTFIKAFINPFIGVLTALVIISFVLDVLLANPGEQDWTAIIIILTMVIASSILRFWQEWKANASSEALLKMVTNTCYVKRAGNQDEEINITDLVPGDIVMIAAGDMSSQRICYRYRVCNRQQYVFGHHCPQHCRTPCRYSFRQGNQQSQFPADTIHAHHDSVRFPGKRCD